MLLIRSQLKSPLFKLQPRSMYKYQEIHNVERRENTDFPMTRRQRPNTKPETHVYLYNNNNNNNNSNKAPRHLEERAHKRGRREQQRTQ
jgi:hypothetical protein